MQPDRKRSGSLPMKSLRVDDAPSNELNTLARFDFSASARTAWSTGLEFLGGSMNAEYWQASELVSGGHQDGIEWTRSGDLMMLASRTPQDVASDPADQVDDVYSRMLKLAAKQGCPALLRAWNFMPGINVGTDDNERYRRFCVGRARALDAAGYNEAQLCAGTAIGGDDPALRVFLLCSSTPGIHLENPRQVSAFRYPPRYGPRSPSFARATAVRQSDDSVLLILSGTASVVGHETLHREDPGRQLEEIVANVDALLAQAAQDLHRPGLRRFNDHSLVRAYVRRAADWPSLSTRLEQAWPGCRVAGLRGDICRADLLVEIEAVTRA